jgi:hypothetical protein
LTEARRCWVHAGIALEVGLGPKILPYPLDISGPRCQHLPAHRAPPPP